MHKLLVILFLLPFSALSQATEVKGHPVPAKLTTAATELVLNGAGMRDRFRINLYVSGLYLTEKTDNATAIINAKAPMAIRLHVVSGRINSENMTEATLEGFKNATGGNTTPIQAEIDAFMLTFKEAINEGDVFELVYLPEEGVKVFKNDTYANTIPGHAFKQALFSIWLGDKPAQRSLKRDMLGS